MLETPFFGDSFWLIAKVGVLLGLLVYMAFAVIIVRQVILMTNTLELGHEKTIKNLSRAHLVFSAIAFLLALVIL